MSNVPVNVTLTIVGKETKSSYKVTTKGHEITTESGGTHRCDGTNNCAHPSPVPAFTAALDDAAKKNNFTYDATFSSTYDDFFITRIGPDSGGKDYFWSLKLNGKLLQVGGCQQQVKEGDTLLFEFTKVFPPNE